MGLDHIAMETESREAVDEWVELLTANGIKVSGPQIQGPEDGLLEEGSRSYSAAFHDPNGVCFEIFAEPLTVSEYRKVEAQLAIS
jgi:catechol 2,3-dioxygenase-like lactoylglutathione lyase family enzyme